MVSPIGVIINIGVVLVGSILAWRSGGLVEKTFVISSFRCWFLHSFARPKDSPSRCRPTLLILSSVLAVITGETLWLVGTLEKWLSGG